MGHLWDPRGLSPTLLPTRSSATIRQLNGSTDVFERVRVLVHGYVPQLRPLYAQMRLSVAPLRWGAGVKGKVRLSLPASTASLHGWQVNS